MTDSFMCLVVPGVGLQYEIVIFPGREHLILQLNVIARDAFRFVFSS